MVLIIQNQGKMNKEVIKNTQKQIEKATDPKIKEALEKKLKIIKNNKTVQK